MLITIRFLLFDDEERETTIPPLYFAFGIKNYLVTFEDYEECLPLLPEKHKASYKQASKRVKALKSTDRIEFHHPPWL